MTVYFLDTCKTKKAAGISSGGFSKSAEFTAKLAYFCFQLTGALEHRSESVAPARSLIELQAFVTIRVLAVGRGVCWQPDRHAGSSRVFTGVGICDHECLRCCRDICEVLRSKAANACICDRVQIAEHIVVVLVREAESISDCAGQLGAFRSVDCAKLLSPQGIALTVRINRTNRERQKQMRKITKPAKSLFGPLLATALMSIVVAKFLADFASAADIASVGPGAVNTSAVQVIEPEDLAGDARFMGAYKVTQIDSKKGSSVEDLCKDPNQSNSDCSQEVWAYSKESQLILIKAVTTSDLTSDHFSLFSLDGNCKTNGNLADAIQDGLFSMGLCTASGASGSQPLGGTIGLAASDQSLDLPTGSGTLFLPGTNSQGEIKISKNGISIHKYAKTHKGLIPTAAYDHTYTLVPVASSH